MAMTHFNTVKVSSSSHLTMPFLSGLLRRSGGENLPEQPCHVLLTYLILQNEIRSKHASVGSQRVFIVLSLHLLQFGCRRTSQLMLMVI